MTLTQSHIYYEVFKQLEPEIILIDESAENHESEMAHLLSFQPKHYIQVGDHFQLKPIVIDKRLNIVYQYGFSQFQRLFSLNLPHKVLIFQRRMTQHLSKFVRLFYSAEKYKDTVECLNSDNQQLETRDDVIFIPHTYQEAKHQDYPYFVNYFEAFACIKIAERLVQHQKIENKRITILTMYKGQEFLIKEQLYYTYFNPEYDSLIKQIKVCTVDSYQGKENDVIILSCVKSNEIGSIGFLRQANRINVAFSRARQLAFYIGNFSFLQLKLYNEKWKDIYEMAQRGFHIPKNPPSYQQQINNQFQRVQERIKIGQKECMFCGYEESKGQRAYNKINYSHIGNCKQKTLKQIQKREINFWSLEERDQFYQQFSKDQEKSQNYQQDSIDEQDIILQDQIIN